ncbi:MAG: hypothetical protein WCD81_07465 [Candidatus Bathyarchaeia archaeon]
MLEKNIEIPKSSRDILNVAVDEAVNQYVTMHGKDMTIEPLSLFETVFMLGLEFRRKNPPIILVRTYQVGFESKKKSPYSIVVVQPRVPSQDQFREKVTNNGKLCIIKEEAAEDIMQQLSEIAEKLEERVDFVCFPELSFFDKKETYDVLSKIGKEKDCFIIAGSFHDEKTESNISVIFSPQGNWFNQSKIFRSKNEGINEKPIEYLNEFDFLEGRFCVLICIDSEREDIRQILKERLKDRKCPVLVFNPSHTEHPKRATELLANNLMVLISAAIVFCNTNQKGGSTVLVPFVELKDRKFRLFELPPSAKTEIGNAQVDVNLLMENRLSKQNGVVSMTR